MKSLIRSAIANTPAMNTLMVGILVMGTFCFAVMRREVFPEFQLEIVLVSVPYPGASPEEIERGICQKIEEAVQTIDGIKKVTSVAAENAGSVILELNSTVKDVQRVVNEVRSAVDRIPSFPELTEDAKVQQITFREAAINVSVMAPEGETDKKELRAVAEQLRNELLLLPNVSQVEIKGALDYQIDVEVDEETLRKYGLSLPQVAEIVRRENMEMPAGKITSVGQEILVRGKNKRLTGSEIAKLPLVTDPSGVVLSIGDIGEVRDGFTDGTAITETNGRSSLFLEVQRTANEDLLLISEEVVEYCKSADLPAGYEVVTWGDRSIDVRGRLEMLVTNGQMGLLLVFLVLAVFLELRLAFWVAMGIPIAMLGAGGVLLGFGQTLNMLSMFAFLMALGIIVDDAIVVGENIYAHRQMGKHFLQAAVDGTYEVIPSVMASVTTTIIAFCPLLFVSGVMGKFIAVMPLAVIAMLAISLFESMFILPCHLAHEDSVVFRAIGFLFYPLRFVVRFFERINRLSARYLAKFIDSVYTPTLRWAVSNPWIVVSAAVSLLFVAAGVVGGGFVPFNIFPKMDANYLVATVSFPDGTPAPITDSATQWMLDAYNQVDEEFEGVTQVVYRGVGSVENAQGGPGGDVTAGSHVGSITVELFESADRTVTSDEINAAWREKVGDIPGVESITFGAIAMGPGGKPIEFKLLADPGAESNLELAVEECKAKLKTFAGVYDVDDDSRPGKWEFQVSVKDRAKSMGISSQELANTIRASYYGAEVMRLQRGRHEVKLMVRYPPEQRRSLANLEEIRVRTADGTERPITELAEIKVVRGYNEINRLNQKRSITISADIDETIANARDLVSELQGKVAFADKVQAFFSGEDVEVNAFMPELLARYPGLSVSWEGQQEQTQESLSSLFRATGIALIVMFALLTFEFKSYLQPVIILLIIPFGIIGAIIGHAVLGLPLTLFSFFGLVALTGVVVNDSIVLIDFINARVRAGIPAREAVVEAGRRRFRPVLLTSATTVAGLVPILMEKSLQAQILIPMATSLAFGLLLATVLVLVLVPTMYLIYRTWLPYREEHEEEVSADFSAQPALA